MSGLSGVAFYGMDMAVNALFRGQKINLTTGEEIDKYGGLGGEFFPRLILLWK